VHRLLLQLAAAAVLALLVAVPGWIWLHRGDPPGAVAELRDGPGPAAGAGAPSGETTGETQAAGWQALRDLAALMDGIEGSAHALDVALGLEKDAPLERELAAHADAVAEALERTMRQPLVAPPIGADAPRFPSELSIAAAALVQRGRDAIEEGEAERGLTDLVGVVALGHAVQAARGADLGVSMRGIQLATVGLRSIETLLPRLSLDREQSRRVTDGLADLRVDPEAWQEMWAVEYDRFEADFLREDARGNVVDAYTYKPNATRVLFTELYASLQENATRHCGELTTPTEREPTDATRRALALLGPNGGGRLLAWSMAPGLIRFEHMRCGFDTRIGMVRAQIALRAFQGERRRLPDTLEELVPEWLAEVPTDHFDGNPLRFDPDRRLVHSIGNDGVDAYGVTNPTDPLREPVANLRF